MSRNWMTFLQYRVYLYKMITNMSFSEISCIFDLATERGYLIQDESEEHNFPASLTRDQQQVKMEIPNHS